MNKVNRFSTEAGLPPFFLRGWKSKHKNNLSKYDKFILTYRMNSGKVCSKGEKRMHWKAPGRERKMRYERNR